MCYNMCYNMCHSGIEACLVLAHTRHYFGFNDNSLNNL